MGIGEVHSRGCLKNQKNSSMVDESSRRACVCPITIVKILLCNLIQSYAQTFSKEHNHLMTHLFVFHNKR